jgi:hypothetical protein
VTVEGTDVRHRSRSRSLLLGLFPIFYDLLDVGEAESQVLELAYPPNPKESLGPIETKSALGTGRGTEEVELLVQVDSADALARFSSEIPHLHERFPPPLLGRRFDVRVLRQGEERESDVVAHGGQSQTLTLRIDLDLGPWPTPVKLDEVDGGSRGC